MEPATVGQENLLGGRGEGSEARRSTAEHSQSSWRAEARGGGRGISEMVLESQLAWALSEQLSWRVTDPSPAPSLASFSYLLINSLLTEAPSLCLALCWLMLRTQPCPQRAHGPWSKTDLSPDSSCPEWSGLGWRKPRRPCEVREGFLEKGPVRPAGSKVRPAESKVRPEGCAEGSLARPAGGPSGRGKSVQRP